LPEDYEPYPESEGFGDYPKLAFVHNESRPRDTDFDYSYARRNYGEPFHDEQLFSTQFYADRNLKFQESQYVLICLLSSKILLTVNNQLQLNIFYLNSWKSTAKLLMFVASLFALSWMASQTRVVFPKVIVDSLI
jgi:hypothetical protein